MKKLEEAGSSLNDFFSEVAQGKDECKREETSLLELGKRIALICQQADIECPLELEEIYEVEEIKDESNIQPIQPPKRIDDLSSIDIAVVCIAAGLGVLVDFLIVRIPKNANIVRNKKVISQSGSPLTEWMRVIGFTKDSKTAGWVSVLERWFGVNYDTSIIKGENGFCPRTHRLYNLGHDPSPSGLLWALKDMISGTMSFIDKSGCLKIIQTKNVSPFRLLAAPLIWLGHIISDVFTKAGIPIPGSCLLRTLQFGSFGEKKRMLGQVVEYMYLDGYDVRHLMTMSTVNAVIEIIIRLYNYLTKEHIKQFGRPVAIFQADKEMQRLKLEKMRMYGYAVAVAGNTAKLASYSWNPCALNLPVWIEFIRIAIVQMEHSCSTTHDILDYIDLRNQLEHNFTDIERKLQDI